MIKVEIRTYGLMDAIYGMRLPLRSHYKMDTKNDEKLGINDLDLAKRLIKAGTEHRKFLRQIHVTMNITAPQYWWREMDTYKVGTTANSSSQMHMIMKRPLRESDFSFEEIADDYIEDTLDVLNEVITEWNNANSEGKEYYFRCLIQMIPQSYNYERIVTCNMEVLWNIYNQRKNHKLREWRTFCKYLETLPLFKQLFLDDSLQK